MPEIFKKNWAVLTLAFILICGWTIFSVRVAHDVDVPRPITGIESLFMEQLTWMEVRDEIKSGKTTVIVATGGIEPNGPYVALGKHNYVLQATTASIAGKLGNALIAPIVKFVPEGDIDPPSGHMKFPGTISVTEKTFRLLLSDICRSLRQSGFNDIVLLGDSGGNQQGMKEVAARLNTEWKGEPMTVHYIPEYYEQDKWSFDFLKTLGVQQKPDVRSPMRAGIHSDYHYEAMMASVNPDTIRTKQRIANDLYSVNGFDMNPPETTVENGKKLVEYRAQLTVEAIRRVIENRK